MALFAVSYDLVKEKNYQELWDEMDRLGAHKALLSLYLLNLDNEDPEDVKIHFSRFIDDDDRLLVLKFTDAAANKCFRGTNAWIGANCP